MGIGEVLWDVYPEDAHFGGAPANFACQAASLGAESWMVSAVGADELGDRAIKKLRERGVDCSLITRDPGHSTGRVLVTLNEARQASYEFAPDPAWDFLEWSDTFNEVATRCDALCFGTLGQRATASRKTIRRFVESTPASALRVFDVNLRQHFYNADIIRESLRIASVVKLNDEELPVVAKLCGLHAGSPREMLAELASQFDLSLVALTRGSHGSLLVAGKAEDWCPAPSVKVLDTVGAGDAFTAALVMGLLEAWPLDAINRHANAVAAFVCTRKGATPVLPDELRDAR